MRMRRRVPHRELKAMLGLIISILLLANILAQVCVAAEEEDFDEKVLREKRYYYRAFNRRDPFRSLITGEFEESEFDLVNIYSVRLVGILSGGMKRFAMLEDNNGYGYIVQAGDPIRNGTIISVGDRSLVARVTMFGQTNSVTLRMEENKRKGE